MNFVIGTGQRHRAVKLWPVVWPLGGDKTAALPALHALSDADNTGRFAGKRKDRWWKVFQEADQDIITVLVNLGTSEPPPADTMAAIEKLICRLYVRITSITTVKGLGWWLF